MPLSEFQKEKVLKVFNNFYDVNGDGVVDWQDFECDIQKLTELLKWTDGCPAKTKAIAALTMIWNDLRTYADKNKDDVITQEEWLKMWDSILEKSKTGDKSQMPKWLTEYVEFMFSINDGNGDDVIDIDEYTQVFKMYGVTEDNCKKAFNKITNNDTIKLTLEEYARLWQEYFLSDDKAARGNNLFAM